jgi:hypothetical protein
MSSQNNMIPRDCSYGCSTRIYWNISENAYFEVFTKKKHNCPNRVNNKSVTTNNNISAEVGSTGTAATTNTKPTYYSKKPWNTQPKPKMSNSFEYLQGSITEIQKKYEILSDIATEYNVRFMVPNEIGIQRLVLLIYWYIMKFH